MADKNKLEKYISLLKKGELDAFDDFYYESYQELYYYILSIIRDRHSAEDLLQDTYMKILQSLNRYKNGTNAFAWMVTIARNLSINQYKKLKRSVIIEPDHEMLLEENDYSLGPITELMLEVLSRDEVEIVTMHAIYQFKHREIAQIVKKPLGTVLWIYNQAVKKLKERGESINERKSAD